MNAPCLRCGKQTGHTLELSGLLSATVFACETCFEGDMAEFRERQRQFQELIDAGMPRASANLIMIARIDESKASCS